MTDDKQPFDKADFELQYKRWIAVQISDQVFYDYINEHGIDMNAVLDLANEAKRLSEVKPPTPGSDLLGDLYVPPAGNTMLDQCLKCGLPVMEGRAHPDAPGIWLHVDADRDYDHLAKVLAPMAIDDITGLHSVVVEVEKNSEFEWDELDQATRYMLLHAARAKTDPDYPSTQKKYVPGHTEDLRRALDATGGPIEQD